MTMTELSASGPGVASVRSIQLGRIAPLGPEGVPSGFLKKPIAGGVKIGRLGLVGDEQADRRVHGGVDKAVYAYAAANYPKWAAQFPEHADQLEPGVFGENLTVLGLEEDDLCVGDIHAAGGVKLQVCQPRQPCFKFGLRLSDNRLPNAMLRSGRSGWYYKVLQEGILSSGDEIRLVERPNPHLPFKRLVEIVYGGQASEHELETFIRGAGLAESLRTSLKDLRARHI